MTKGKVLLADKETMFAEGVRMLLDRHFHVVGIAVDGKALLHASDTLRPDVIVTDVALPMVDGIDALAEFKKRRTRPKVIFLTLVNDPATVTEALRAGAAGYVLKTAPPSELVACIKKVLKGETYITPRLAFKVGKLPRYQSDFHRSLTQRERVVLRLVADGKTSKEIAAALNISTKTVESHRANISQHLDIHSIAGLTRYAIEHGML